MKEGSLEERNKAVIHRWIYEMYGEGRFELMPELAGPKYIRHEKTGTFTVDVDDYWKVIRDRYGGEKARTLVQSYELLAEGDKVCMFGTSKGYRMGGTGDYDVYNGVQVFRLENEKIVETWFPGFAVNVEW
jgi:predicted SnoaL-like aldol condensation-catalyzing enzyme